MPPISLSLLVPSSVFISAPHNDDAAFSLRGCRAAPYALLRKLLLFQVSHHSWSSQSHNMGSERHILLWIKFSQDRQAGSETSYTSCDLLYWRPTSQTDSSKRPSPTVTWTWFCFYISISGAGMAAAFLSVPGGRGRPNSVGPRLTVLRNLFE